MERYICIHGHFYQPPRENPWLEEIELQDSAYPYHDWNERVTSECYAPNSASRILDEAGRIACIVNNYSRISFNFGPTLLQWIEHKEPRVYESILAADRESRSRFSGHGSALAQAYSHMIMPLANRRDKQTQIQWGIRDFERRFGRSPEGMWLPETAADLETLAMMAEHGIQFTILSPYQASRVRPMGSRNWVDVSGGRVDPSTPYRVNLRSGRHIAVFFYDGPISRAVAFEKLLIRGEYLVDRMTGAFSDARPWPQLIHIATDGETYGHHQFKGDMGLAYALHLFESRGVARLTNYGEFLEQHPPTHEAQIFENTAWSCAHGVERWRSNCGCSMGGRPGWSQEWRGPLRAALDWLRDSLAAIYGEQARKLLTDPWRARTGYIDVLLDRSPASLEAYFEREAIRPLEPQEKTHALKLLEMQRHAMLMFTSCGWFFDEISGIETVQVLQYAARALQLAADLSGRALEGPFLDVLSQAPSNLPEYANGRVIYEQLARKSMVDLKGVAAHYAVSSLFEEYPERSRIYCYDVTQEDRRSFSAGEARLVVGRASVESAITHETERFTYGVLYLGEHHVSGGIRSYRGAEPYDATVQQIAAAFGGGDFAETLRSVDHHFDAGTYSLKLLFRDQQRRIVRRLLEARMARAEASYRLIYESDCMLMYFVQSLEIPLPNRFRMAADFILNTDLRRAFESAELDAANVEAKLAEVHRLGVALDVPTLEFALRRTVENMAADFHRHPMTRGNIGRLSAAAKLTRSLPFPVELWQTQNLFHEVVTRLYPAMRASAADGDSEAADWVAALRALAGDLMFAPLE